MTHAIAAEAKRPDTAQKHPSDIYPLRLHVARWIAYLGHEDGNINTYTE